MLKLEMFFMTNSNRIKKYSNMKYQKKIIKAVIDDTSNDYLKVLLKLDNNPNILEAFFVMLAEKKLTLYFEENKKKFLSLAKKLNYDTSKILKQYNNPNINNSVVYFRLVEDFSFRNEYGLLRSLKDELK